MMERRCSFLVVRSGKPAPRSKYLMTEDADRPRRSGAVLPRFSMGQDMVEQVQVLLHVRSVESP